MALIDKASLLFVPSVVAQEKAFNILPSGNRAPDSTDQNSGYDQTRADFTFDRGSNAAATRIGSDGLIKKYRENLLLQSNQFDTTWLSNGTFTSGQSGYDGTNDAWRFNSDATSMYQITSLVTSGIVTFSVYAKIGSARGIRLRFDESAPVSDANCYIDLTDGSEIAAHNGVDLDVQSVGGGWYRIAFTHNATNLANVRFYALDAAGLPVIGNIYIQDAQLETSMVSTDYLDSGATTAKAGVLIDLPRINYDANGENGSLLLEPQRANLVQYSEYLNGLSKTGMTITDNATTSPEGADNASKIAYLSGQSYVTGGSGLSAGTTYTFSGFFKADENHYVIINNAGASATNAFYNLSDGTHSGGSGITTDLIDYGNGWYRLVYTFNVLYNAIRIYMSGNGSYGNYPPVGEGFFAWGFQTEVASYPSSYIPNHGESGGVTRAADTCSVTGVSDVIGQTEGTFYMDADFVAGNGEDQTILIGVTGYNDYMFIQMNSSDILEAGIIVNTTEVARIGEVKTSGRYKCAFAYADNDFAFYVNGEQVGTDSSGSMSGFAVDLINLNFNTKKYGLRQFNLFNERLSNAELAALTA